MKTFAEHCIEEIRLYIMYQPDINMWTYEWRDGTSIPYPNHEIAHTCVNWAKLEAWAREHPFSIHDRSIQWPNGEPNNKFETAESSTLISNIETGTAWLP